MVKLGLKVPKAPHDVGGPNSLNLVRLAFNRVKVEFGGRICSSETPRDIGILVRSNCIGCELWRFVMYGVLRSYSGDGAKKLTARLEERKTEVEALLRGVPGLITWGLMRTPDGCTTFTLCKDKAGADQSVTIARDWVKKNASDISAPAPTITEGPVNMRITT